MRRGPSGKRATFFSLAMIAEPPIDLFDFWAMDWQTGPASDGLTAYFEKWFAHPASQGDPEFARFAGVSVWRNQNFLGAAEFVLLDREDPPSRRSGARLRYLSLNHQDTGEVSSWAFLEGLTDLGVAWRRDLIEVFDGEPAYEEIRDIMTRYWQNNYVPRLIMQIDPASMDFFFVPREERSEP